MAADGHALDVTSEGSPGIDLVEVAVAGRLASLTLHVGAGRRVALLGRNGVGKSTVLAVASGLLEPERGFVRTPQPVGYVPQAFAPSLLPWLRAEANVLLGVPRGERNRARERVLNAIPPLGGLLDAWPYRLSGGEQQLVAIGRALARSPRVLLLDEPFSALDLATRVSVRDALGEWCRVHRCTAVLVTHDLDDALAFATHAVLLAGAPAEVVYDGPIDRFQRAELERRVVHGGQGAAS